MWAALMGKKTYIVTILATIVFALARLGHLDAQAEQDLYKLLGITGLATLRAGIKK